MGGHKAIARRGNWILSTEIVIEAIIVGVGFFEAVLFILGSLTGTVPPVTLGIAALYFAIPYNLLIIGMGMSGQILHMSTRRKTWGVLLLNAPFMGYLLWQGTAPANYCLLALVTLGLLFNMPKVHIRTIPGVDVVGMALFLAGPFVYGALLADVGGIWWLAAWLSVVLVAAANYLMYKLPMIGLERTLHVDSTDARLGLERSLMASIGMYIVAALLPIFAYGLWGIPATILILWYVLIAFQAIPYRMLAGAAGLYRVWQAIWWLNYPIGIILGAYAWYLIVAKA